MPRGTREQRCAFARRTSRPLRSTTGIHNGNLGIKVTYSLSNLVITAPASTARQARSHSRLEGQVQGHSMLYIRELNPKQQKDKFRV